MFDSQILYDELNNEDAANAAYQALREAGGRVYIVGGAVRDTLLGKQPHDIDLMVTGLDAPSIKRTLRALPGHATFAGKNFGVFHYHYNDSTVEIAMPRTEHSTGEGHKDFAVNADPTLTPQEDLGRRDFTANAIAFDLDSGELIDPYNGSQDIESGKLRLVSDKAFQEDPLRIVRALVAYAKHGLAPDEETLTAMTQNAPRIRALPAERIQMEMDKIMSSPNPAGAINLAYETGILPYILPEIEAAMGFDQRNKYHDLPVGEHSLQVLKKMTDLSSDPDLRMAALLHDIGKPPTYWEDPAGQGHFYQHDDVPGSANHEDVGADMAHQALTRLKYPNSRRNRIVNLVQNHMFPYFTSENGARKFVNKHGVDTAYDLMDLREADSSGKKSMQMTPVDSEKIGVGRALLDKVTQDQQPFAIKDLAINGRDLISLGIQPGPQMGAILNDLLQDVIANPALNSRDQLINIVRSLHEST